MLSMTYVEIDLPVCSLIYGVAPCTAAIPTTGDIKCYNSKATCQDRAHYTESQVTVRFAKQADYLPADIDCIPSIAEVSYSPSTIAPGESLGTRASLTITFRDHPHADTGQFRDAYLADRSYDPWRQGTFWGKFRARQPFLRGAALRWLTYMQEDGAFVDLDTRHFVVDSTDGPTPDGKFTIIAKDVLKLADGDRAQAPRLSNGYLSADITAAATSATLLPSGIGNAEYPSVGYVCIGGNEVMPFTRSGDTLTLLQRGALGSTASAHKAQDRVQLTLYYQAQPPASIIYDFLVTYAGIDPSYITLADWQAEDTNFLGSVYTGVICEPTSVATLVSELIEQAALAIWPDEKAQRIRYQVLRAINVGAATFSPDNTLMGTLTLKDQPDKRLSRVQVYFGRIDPTKPLNNLDNYRSTSLTIDDDAEADYGSAAIKTIMSRWIPQAGRSIADRLGAVLLGRFRDPPRKIGLATARYAGTDIELGAGYRVQSFCVQDATGAPGYVPMQIVRLDPRPDRFQAEGLEMLWRAPAADANNRYVIFDVSRLSVNLRTEHDSIFPAPVAGNVINAVVNAGIIIGGSTGPAFDVSSWPAGVTINLLVYGRIQGRGGDGGSGGSYIGAILTPATPGGGGGTAIYTRYAINLSRYAGSEIFGGGGGGGGGGYGQFRGGGGGGGGAGTTPGGGGLGGPGSIVNGNSGLNATADGPGGGGAGGGAGVSGAGGTGADGGTLGSPGGYGLPGSLGVGQPGGAAGNAIDGVAYVTTLLSGGTILGPQI